MTTLDFERYYVGRVQFDFCFPCQVIWFDTMERQQLTARGVLDVFSALNEHKVQARNTLPGLLSCPRCHARLELTHDLQHTTHFTYFRCPFGHGRLTPFFQFLLEKNFVRPITGAELSALRAKVQQIQCSNCGAPIDLEHDNACKYCGSPISILDPDAVATTVRSLTQTDQREHSIDVGKLTEALAMYPPEGSNDRSPFVADLVGVGLALVAGMLLRL